MPKRARRWPIWKIALTTAGCAGSAGILVWLSRLAERAAPVPTTDPATPPPPMTFPTLLLMLALMAAILATLGVVWLAVRIREASKPAWERPGRKRRR